MALYAIVRVRGTVDVPPDVEHALNILRLRRRFAAVVYHSSLPGIRGMLESIASWATWGEVDRETLVELLRRRGRLAGGKPLTESWVREKLGLNGFEEFAGKLLSGDIHYHKLESLGVKPFFRLHPPKGGFKGSTRKAYSQGGELGYRGSNINELLKSMI